MTADDALGLLTGAEAGGLLSAALGDDELVSWRLRQVDHRPGSSTTVAYEATVRGAQGEHRQVLAATTGLPAAEAASCALVVDAADARVALWRFPLDPTLPALATAVDEQAVRALLTSYGVPRGPIRLDVRSYRPRRRAVVEVQAPGRRLFLKVLRPQAVSALHERHRLLGGAGLPVPRALGWTGQGLLVLEGLRGTPLRTRLREGGSPAPEGADLVALLDRLPAEVCALPRRRSWTDEAAHYARVLGAALPAESQRAADLATSILRLAGDRPPDEPSHGDFYETQLLLEGSRVSGLLDVDTVGPGRRTDDLACLLAHVSVLAQMEPTHRESSNTLGARWLAAFERTAPAVELRARVAGVVLSLATGPYRVQQRGWQEATRERLELAEQWLGAARRRAAPVG